MLVVGRSKYLETFFYYCVYLCHVVILYAAERPVSMLFRDNRFCTLISLPSDCQEFCFLGSFGFV